MSELVEKKKRDHLERGRFGVNENGSFDESGRGFFWNKAHQVRMIRLFAKKMMGYLEKGTSNLVLKLVRIK